MRKNDTLNYNPKLFDKHSRCKIFQCWSMKGFTISETTFKTFRVIGIRSRVVKTDRFLYPVNLSRKRPVNRRTVIYLLFERRFYTSGSRS